MTDLSSNSTQPTTAGAVVNTTNSGGQTWTDDNKFRTDFLVSEFDRLLGRYDHIDQLRTSMLSIAVVLNTASFAGIAKVLMDSRMGHPGSPRLVPVAASGATELDVGILAIVAAASFALGILNLCFFLFFRRLSIDHAAVDAGLDQLKQDLEKVASLAHINALETRKAELVKALPVFGSTLQLVSRQRAVFPFLIAFFLASFLTAHFCYEQAQALNPLNGPAIATIAAARVGCGLLVLFGIYDMLWSIERKPPVFCRHG